MVQDTWLRGQVYPVLSHKGYLRDLRRGKRPVVRKENLRGPGIESLA